MVLRVEPPSGKFIWQVISLKPAIEKSLYENHQSWCSTSWQILDGLSISEAEGYYILTLVKDLQNLKNAKNQIKE